MALYIKRPPCSKEEFQRIAKAVEKLSGLAEWAAYTEALTTFSPAQMGALHRRLNALSGGDYFRDAEPI